MTGDGFTYLGSPVLKNKDNIADDIVFEHWLSERTQARSLQLYFMPPPAEFNSHYLREIHRHIFQDAFEWAGHSRDVPFTFADGTTASMPIMRKEGAKVAFASGYQIQKGLEAFDNTLKERDYLKGLSRESFIENAAGIFAFLNHIHPFREGNGRTQRAFFEKLAIAAGHKLDFSIVTAERMARVSIAASENQDLAPMKHMFEDISNPQKQHILKEFFAAMRKNNVDDINYRYVVAAKDGASYTGRFVGGGPDSFAMIVHDSDIVIGKRSDLTQEQSANLRKNDVFTFSLSIAEKAKNMNVDTQYLIPPLAVAELEPDSLSMMASNSRGVRSCREEVEHFARLVYGCSHALENEILAIDKNPREGERIVGRIENESEIIAPLAGKEKLFGKDQVRKDAQANIIRLSQAVENYANASSQARHEILEQHNTEQRRLSQVVERPSREMQDVLAMPKEQQFEVLAKSPELQDKINSYMAKVDNRLSAEEHRAIAQGDYSQLAKSLNVSESQAKLISYTVNQTRAAHTQMAAARTLNQNQNISRINPSPSRSR